MKNVSSKRISYLRLFSQWGLLSKATLISLVFASGIVAILLLNSVLFLSRSAYQDFSRDLDLRRKEILQLKHSGSPSWLWKQSLACKGVMRDLQSNHGCVVTALSFKQPQISSGTIQTEKVSSLCLICHREKKIEQPVYWHFSAEQPLYAINVSATLVWVINFVFAILWATAGLLFIRKAHSKRPVDLVYTTMRIDNRAIKTARANQLVKLMRGLALYLEQGMSFFRFSMTTDDFNTWIQACLSLAQGTSAGTVPANQAPEGENITVVSMSDSFTGVPVSAESLRMTAVISTKAPGKIVIEKSLAEKLVLPVLPGTKRAVWKTRKGAVTDFFIF